VAKLATVTERVGSVGQMGRSCPSGDDSERRQKFAAQQKSQEHMVPGFVN